MKKKLLVLPLILAGFFTKAQNGLEDIIVEKYYISEANDTNANSVGGILPIGSTTYRIYVDMLPGYTFQAAYGVDSPPPVYHELRIETTTEFFNNTDYGSTSPTFSKNNSAKNTVMLDSWLSVGAACNGFYGVLKTDDNGLNTNVNSCSGCSATPILQSTNPDAGIPLATQDGLLAGTPASVTSVGINTDVFAAGFSNGPLFSTVNGSWAALGGATGPDANTNRVLIAQLTTNGVLTFKLNLQLGTPGGGTENYVAENPVGSEFQHPALIYDSGNLTNLQDLNPTGSVYKIYPNPVKDNLNIEVKNSNADNKKQYMFYTIYSMEGKEVIANAIPTMTNNYSDTIDLSHLNKGIYFMQINLNGVVSTKKLIKL
jgi:hypothetical protein